jgi:hypothetical protein
MTTVRVYRNTDAFAPALTGTAGSLTTVLDAVLVNGYGSQAPAGWTIGQTNTNQRQYINSPTDGTGLSIWIDDTAPGGGGGREARATGFESMSAPGAGSGQFPTAAQLPIGIGATVIRKSNTADTTARKWTVVADDTCFYLFVETGDYTAPLAAMSFMFGDFFSYKAGDAYRCTIIGRNSENTNSSLFETFTAFPSMNQSLLTATFGGHFVPRPWTGVGGSTPCGKHFDVVKMGGVSCSGGTGNSGTSILVNQANSNASFGANYSAPAFFPYPNGPDGGLYLSPVWLHHSNAVRGYYKGLWAPLHHLPLTHNDIYAGTGNMSGKTFLVQNVLMVTGSNGVPAQVHVEISSTWS